MKNSVSRFQAEKKYHHIPRDDNLPLAIGANFHDDPICVDTLRKSHNLRLPRRVDHAPHTEYQYGGTSSAQRASSRREMTLGSDEEEVEDVWTAYLSSEITEKEKADFVVRFLALFTEKVPESAVETERIRRVAIRYHVADNSISIQEARQENSGIVQSTILSRRQIPKDGQRPEDLLLLDDFQIGSSVSIYQRTYHIMDMDARSRRYYETVRGEDVPPPVPWPNAEDLYESTIKPGLKSKAIRQMTSDDMDLKRAAEQQLTGIYTKHSNEDISIAQQFIKNKINEHLTFLALWDDRQNLSGDLHFCVIKVYLDNNAIEIVEQRGENSGRDGGPILVSRQRVPKPDVDISKSRYQEHTYGKLMKNDFLCPEDFDIGKVFQIYGKPFFVYNCDSATREFMKAHHNMDLQPAIDISPYVEENHSGSVFYPPPPNGFGSEREMRRNWLSLTAKPMLVDLEKMHRETGRKMVFAARLAKPLVKGDEGREFVITFNRETDELDIMEKPARNSGFMGGRFLSKGKHRKVLPDGTTVVYQPEDFVVGQEILIFDRPFLLTAMDEKTRTIVENSDVAISPERIAYLADLLKKQINLKFRRTNEAFRALAPQGTLGYKQIVEFLCACSCHVSDDEGLLVVQNLFPESSGAVSYAQFLDFMNTTVAAIDDPAASSRRAAGNVATLPDISMRTGATESKDAKRYEELRKQLQQKLIQRKGTLQEQFRSIAEHSPTSKLNKEAFRRSLNAIMQFNMPPKDEEMLVSMLFDGSEDENGDITFKQFQEFVDRTP